MNWEVYSLDFKDPERLFKQHLFMGGVLVDDVQAPVIFHQPVGVEHLSDEPVAAPGLFRKQAAVEHLHLLCGLGRRFCTMDLRLKLPG